MGVHPSPGLPTRANGRAVSNPVPVGYAPRKPPRRCHARGAPRKPPWGRLRGVVLDGLRQTCPPPWRARCPKRSAGHDDQKEEQRGAGASEPLIGGGARLRAYANASGYAAVISGQYAAAGQFKHRRAVTPESRHPSSACPRPASLQNCTACSGCSKQPRTCDSTAYLAIAVERASAILCQCVPPTEIPTTVSGMTRDANRPVSPGLVRSLVLSSAAPGLSPCCRHQPSPRLESGSLAGPVAMRKVSSRVRVTHPGRDPGGCQDEALPEIAADVPATSTARLRRIGWPNSEKIDYHCLHPGEVGHPDAPGLQGSHLVAGNGRKLACSSAKMCASALTSGHLAHLVTLEPRRNASGDLGVGGSRG